MREKERSFGEGVKEAWYFFVDELAPFFLVGGLIIATIVAMIFTVVAAFS